MKIQDIMTHSVDTVGPEEDARSVYRKFGERGVHHMPVIENGRTIGILSTSDYQGVVHHAEKGGTISADMVFGGLSVRSLMTENPFTLPPDAPIERAASLMLDQHVHAVPVVEHGILRGIITARDILAGVARGSLKVSR